MAKDWEQPKYYSVEIRLYKLWYMVYAYDGYTIKLKLKFYG